MAPARTLPIVTGLATAAYFAYAMLGAAPKSPANIEASHLCVRYKSMGANVGFKRVNIEDVPRVMAVRPLSAMLSLGCTKLPDHADT